VTEQLELPTANLLCLLAAGCCLGGRGHAKWGSGNSPGEGRWSSGYAAIQSIGEDWGMQVATVKLAVQLVQVKVVDCKAGYDPNKHNGVV